MTTSSTERLWNPLDPAFRADPYRFYDRLRTDPQRRIFYIEWARARITAMSRAR